MAVDQEALDPRERAFYGEAIDALAKAGVPFLIGGAYALLHYTGMERHTKDIDIYVRPRDRQRAFDVLTAQGCAIEGVFHWIGKAYKGENCVDVICGSTDGIIAVDDEWFAHAPSVEILDHPLSLCPAEELIWAKGFLMERERYDGADVAHLLLACAPHLDWPRLLRRFGPHWRVLLSHLILFGFIYPGERDKIPMGVMEELIGRLQHELHSPPSDERICQGTLLSWRMFLPDIEQWGYKDARIVEGYVAPDDIKKWTDAFRDT